MLPSGKIQTVKRAPPPPELPILGKIDPSLVSFIGRTNYTTALEEKKFIFGIKRVDRRRHIYIVGKSGVGKSKLIELLIRQDIAYGYGLCFIDPYGDIIQSLLDFIPEKRIDDVVLIDPTNTKQPLLFNPIADSNIHTKNQLIQGLIEILKKSFGFAWTSKLEHLFRFALIAILDYPNATLKDIVFLLTDEKYRQQIIPHIKDDLVKRFWENEFGDWAEKFGADTIIPLLNKLNQFLSDHFLKNILSGKENKIKLEDLIEQKKIILINLSKNYLGEENSSFFGSIFITKLKQAGIARTSLPESTRHDFYIYIDEFHNLATEDFKNILFEAKKYGFCLTIAHQYMGQLSPQLQSAILGGVGSIIVFRVSGEDATKLKQEMAPVFEVKDMINLGTQEFYIKETIDGETYDPFSAETLKILPPPHPSFRNEIIKRSSQKFNVNSFKEMLLEKDNF